MPPDCHSAADIGRACQVIAAARPPGSVYHYAMIATLDWIKQALKTPA
jgi:hypothetical protein